MYQTPQGVVYAAGAAGTVNIPEALVLNYQAAHQSKYETILSDNAKRIEKNDNYS